MDDCLAEKKQEKVGILAWVYLTLFLLLVIAGVLSKRVYYHPELVPAFHVPAAVFLVLAGYRLTSIARKKYERDIENWK